MTLSRHSAPGPAAGFAYQFERALNWLAQKDAGSCIGVETDDDIAVRNSDSTMVLEQDKHSVRETAQPFDDRSHGLWNTLATWIDAVDSGYRSVEATSFLMVTNNAVPECIARRIARAGSDKRSSSTTTRACSASSTTLPSSCIPRVRASRPTTLKARCSCASSSPRAPTRSRRSCRTSCMKST